MFENSIIIASYEYFTYFSYIFENIENIYIWCATETDTKEKIYAASKIL